MMMMVAQRTQSKMQNALGAIQMPSKVNLHTCKEDKFGADLKASIHLSIHPSLSLRHTNLQILRSYFKLHSYEFLGI